MNDFVWNQAFGNSPSVDPSLPIGSGNTASCNSPESAPFTVDVASGRLMGSAGFSLVAQKYDLAVNYYYNGNSSENGEYGVSRSASVRSRIVSSTSSNRVTFQSGDLQNYGYDKVGTSGGVTTYTAVSDNGSTATLSYYGSTFSQYYSNGMQFQYTSQGAGADTFSLSKVVDAEGVAQTYVYGTGAESGLLKTIEVAGGRKVTFTYSASTPTSLVSSIEDWSGRRWTYQ